MLLIADVNILAEGEVDVLAERAFGRAFAAELTLQGDKIHRKRRHQPENEEK